VKAKSKASIDPPVILPLYNYKRLLKKVLNWAGLVFFIMAAVAIYSQLAKYSFSEIKDAMFSIPKKNFVYAMTACIMGYIVLAVYDRLALRYVGRTLAPWKWLLAGFLGFAVSNNAGTAVVSGAAIRYRLYTRWRFRIPEIFKMIMFSGFTYLVGCLFLVVIGYFLVPKDMRSTSVVAIAYWPCLGALIIYFLLAAFYEKGINMGEYTLRMPSVGTAVMQGTLGTCDSLFASLVLYSVLYPLLKLPFDVYLGVFVISQVLGVFTPVPGALGVFEGLFLFLLPAAEGNEAAVFGALIAYRVIYFLIPLVIAGLTMFIIPLCIRYRNYRKKKLCQADLRTEE